MFCLSLSQSLKKAVSPFFLVPLFVASAALSAAPKHARAMGIGPYATCGTMCMSMYGTTFSPFMNMPMFPMTPGYGAYYQTGQWGSPMAQDPRYAMAAALGWRGAQPMGTNYLPPIGLSAIQNSTAAGALGF